MGGHRSWSFVLGYLPYVRRMMSDAGRVLQAVFVFTSLFYLAFIQSTSFKALHCNHSVVRSRNSPPKSYSCRNGSRFISIIFSNS